MLDAIRFVQGSVARKGFVPELTHFNITNKTIRGFNGHLSLCSPIDFDLDVSPKAVPFVKAIQSCDETIQLNVTATGRLSIKSGKFRAQIECLPTDFPEVLPEGEEIPLSRGIRDVLKKLLPFIAEDASRPWARGILLRGQSAFATNNINLVEHWLGYSFPVEINIPRSAVVELVRIGEEPISLQMTETSCTFHFPGKRWLRTNLNSTDWPDVSRVLNMRVPNLKHIPEDLWVGLEKIEPFADDMGRVYFSPGMIATGDTEDASSAVQVTGLDGTGVYNIKQMRLLQDVATRWCFGEGASPSLFFGENIRGAISGLRG
jgi:DNA polymerase III sliding clamp (beta) subunit (PCNA family)